MSLLFVAMALASMPSFAIVQGVSNTTLKPGSTGAGCATCHNPQGGNVSAVTISGPTTLDAGTSAIFTVTATQATPADGVKMGVNIAADDTNALSLVLSQQTKLVNGEITHTGPDTSLPVTASGAASYQFRYTMPLSAASGTLHKIYATAALSFTGWQHAADFTVTTGAAASNPPRLFNLSTRMQVLTGNDVLIGGFVVGGSANKTVVVRARGPSLVPFGITNALPNPLLQLVRSSDQSTVASNNDWQTNGNAAEITASGFAPSDALESALLVSLPPGAYTAIVTGAGGGTGVGIVEVFEVDAALIPLTNISTRGQVLTGNDVMIGGFVIQGTGPQTVVVRARGPSLVPFGITNALADPQLQLVRSSDQAQIAFNNDWQTAANVAQIIASGFAPSNDLESAILVTLDPGAYTAIVTGVSGSTGVGIVEVFATP